MPVALAARYASAAAEALVGGDLYEVRAARPGAVRLLIGDVRGKGLEAVRTATVVLGAFRAAAADLDDLGAVARQMDKRVCATTSATEDFVTALLADVADDGTLRPRLLRAPAAAARRGATGDRAEVAPSAAARARRGARVDPGGCGRATGCCCYTDGILEARDPQGRFLDLAAARPAAWPPAASRTASTTVLAGLRQAVGGALGDDLALLLAEYAPD